MHPASETRISRYKVVLTDFPILFVSLLLLFAIMQSIISPLDMLLLEESLK